MLLTSLSHGASGLSCGIQSVITFGWGRSQETQHSAELVGSTLGIKR
jgi:hypothetical protein